MTAFDLCDMTALLVGFEGYHWDCYGKFVTAQLPILLLSQLH